MAGGKISHALKRRLVDRADAEIVQILHERCGLQINSISDLVNTRESFPEAYPVLIDLLDRKYPIRIREMIVRALTDRNAGRPAYAPLVQMYEAPESGECHDLADYESLRYALANAIAHLADKADRDKLKAWASDSRYGTSRSAFIDAMKRWKDSSVDSIILACLEDPDTQYSAVEAARTRKLTVAIPILWRLSGSTNRELGRTAKKAARELEQNATN